MKPDPKQALQVRTVAPCACACAAPLALSLGLPDTEALVRLAARKREHLRKLAVEALTNRPLPGQMH